jgi:hypothetical protein
MHSALATITRTLIVHKALGIFFLVGLLSTNIFAQLVLTQQDIEQRRIQYLISAVADLKDARFVRNGSEYDAQQAAEHLRSKLRYAGDRIKTAEDFIAHCATGSSMSGEKYRIKFADGRMVDTATFLHEKLAAYPQWEHNASQSPRH